MTDFVLSGGAVSSMSYCDDNGNWVNIDYVRKVKQIQTSGTKIATAKNSDGTDTDIYVPNMIGAGASTAGSNGLVPAPSAGDNNKFLRGDGTWQTAGGGNDVGLSVVNGAIDSTYDDDGTDVTEDILKDSTGEQIADILDSIADEIQLLGQPEVYAPIVYSTEEREIGVGENGKPLYQKTIKSNLISADTNVATGLTGIDTFHLVSIKTIQSNNTQNAPSYISMYNYQGSGTYYGLIYLENNTLYYSNMSRTNSLYIEAVIQYTKTTDTAGSGHYAALGVPAVHYSTNEQVVGTWIDGRTIYQITYDLTSSPFALTTSWKKLNNVSNIQPLSGKALVTSSQAVIDIIVDVDSDGTYIRSYLAYNNVDYVTIQYIKLS